MIVGVDEAGRGPLAGAVVGCALYLKENPPSLIKDSKKLSPCLRERAFHWLTTNAIFSLGLATPCEIDRFNILEATFLAFQRAIKSLFKKAPYLKKATFIIDGNIFRTNLNLNYICLKEADRKVKEVSGASIVAKVVRDHLMGLADFLYPQWNFSQHKGYPTRDHFFLIDKYFLSPFHRRMFSPCQMKLGFIKRQEDEKL